MNSRLGYFILMLSLSGCASQARVRSLTAEVKSIEDGHFQQPAPRDAALLGRRLEDVYNHGLERQVSAERLKKLDDKTLKEVFAAVRKAAFYSGARAPVRGLGTVFEELVRRGINTERDAQDLYDRLVVLGLLNEAGNLSKKYAVPNRDPLPNIVEPPGMSEKTRKVFAVSEDGKTLTVEVAQVGQERLIAFVSHPNCSPSLRVNALIDSDPLLRCAFEANALVLNPPDAVLKPGDIAEWNKAHPGRRNRIAYSKADWPDIGLSSTPGFYFMRDGKVVYKALGQPTPEETRAVILEGLRSIGINSCP